MIELYQKRYTIEDKQAHDTDTNGFICWTIVDRIEEQIEWPVRDQTGFGLASLRLIKPDFLMLKRQASKII